MALQVYRLPLRPLSSDISFSEQNIAIKKNLSFAQVNDSCHVGCIHAGLLYPIPPKPAFELTN